MKLTNKFSTTTKPSSDVCTVEGCSAKVEAPRVLK